MQPTVRQQIIDLLKSTTLTYKEIAARFNLSRQRIHQIYVQATASGENIPSRKEVGRKVRKKMVEELLQIDKAFIEIYKQTYDYQVALTLTGIEPRRARFVLRCEGYNPNRLISRDELATQYHRQPHTGIHLYVLRDILDAKLTATQIAQKWNRTVPYIFNLMQECRNAKIEVPELPDGRTVTGWITREQNGTYTPNQRICKTCNATFVPKFTDAHGEEHRAFHDRAHCFTCVPFVAQKDCDANP
jgi:hypothetical protein